MLPNLSDRHTIGAMCCVLVHPSNAHNRAFEVDERVKYTHKGNEQCAPGLERKKKWSWRIVVTPTSMQDNYCTKAKEHYPAAPN